MNSMISTQEPNTLSGIYEDIEFFIKNILETDMGIELADMDLMLTFNQGLGFILRVLDSMERGVGFLK